MGCCGGKTGCKKTKTTERAEIRSPVDINVTPHTIELNFGPNQVFNLKIPVTQSHNRGDLVRQLRAAADKLELAVAYQNLQYDPVQQLLPFSDAT